MAGYFAVHLPERNSADPWWIVHLNPTSFNEFQKSKDYINLLCVILYCIFVIFFIYAFIFISNDINPVAQRGWAGGNCCPERRLRKASKRLHICLRFYAFSVIFDYFCIFVFDYLCCIFRPFWAFWIICLVFQAPPPPLKGAPEIRFYITGQCFGAGLAAF
jgi:hypothetical protein